MLNSVYEKAMNDKIIASFILLPLIEFEFAFNGSQKPAITQSEDNLPQLYILFDICRRHNWLSTKKISKLGQKNEYWFKISNNGFKEIYNLAGPLADIRKDSWAQLLCERANNKEKNRNMKDEILQILNLNNGLSTKQICLKTRRLPYTVTRHLKGLEKEFKITKNNNMWFLVAPQHTRPHEAEISSKRAS